MTGLQVFGLIVLPLLTVVCSGVVSAIVTYKLNASKQEQAFRRDKLEVFYVAVHAFCTNLATRGLRYLPVMRQEISYNAALDMEIESAKEGWGRDAGQKATMLVTIYFCDLQPALDELFRVRNDMNAVLEEHKAWYKKGNTDGMRFVEPLMKQLARLDVVEHRFDDLIKEQAAKIG